MFKQLRLLFYWPSGRSSNVCLLSPTSPNKSKQHHIKPKRPTLQTHRFCRSFDVFLAALHYRPCWRVGHQLQTDVWTSICVSVKFCGLVCWYRAVCKAAKAPTPARTAPSPPAFVCTSRFTSDWSWQATVTGTQGNILRGHPSAPVSSHLHKRVCSTPARTPLIRGNTLERDRVRNSF